MSPEEHDMLKDFIDSQNRVNKEFIEELHTISRGLYGDPQNKVPGLIQRQERDEDDIRKLKAFQTKLSILWGMIIVTAGVVWEFIRAKFL